MDIEFMIKYGKAEHLQQIIDGSLRLTPSQDYIKIEESQHNRGQGDLLEGKMKIHMESARLYDIDTHELIGVLPKSTGIISIQDVSNMPVFCLSHYGSAYIRADNGNFYIQIDEKHLKSVKKDFLNATHALVILQPDKFISDIKNIDGIEFACDKIQYYDYKINTIQMYMFLTTGSSEIKTNKEISMTYKNRYRHLLCKDIAFKNQREYRFIALNKLINDPIFCSFEFTSNYLLVPIDNLRHLSIGGIYPSNDF